MNKAERCILKKSVKSNEGLLSPSAMLISIRSQCKGTHKDVENLVVKSFLESVPVDELNMRGGTYTLLYYRVTEKGLNVFSPIYNKFWFAIRTDVRMIIVSSIITALGLLINRLF